MKNFVAKALNIRPRETWLVKRLFFIQFLLTLAGAFLFITAHTVFISSLPITDLPKAYLLSGIFLLAGNFFYRKMDVAFDVRKLSYSVLFICLALTALFWIYMQTMAGNEMPYVLFIAYNIVYMMMGYIFWTLAALLFNIRDSKRIFTLISAGDLPAKIIAYAMVPLIAYLIGIKNMVFVAIVFMAIAFLLVYRLFNNKNLDVLKYEHEQVHYFKKHSFKARLNRLRRVFGSELIMSLAILAFVSFLAFLLIDFTFLAEVKPKYKTDVELASFLGLFFAIGRIGGIFIKLVFSSRLINRIGIIKTLLFLPLALLAFCALIMVISNVDLPFEKYLYLFGFMTILAEVGRSAIQEPVFFVLFQPLKLDLRMKGHVIAKGYTYPLALIIGGGSLYYYLQVYGQVPIDTTVTILVAVITAWIALVFFVKRTYNHSLYDAIKTGFFRGHELYLTGDATTQKLLLEKTGSSRPAEVIYALHLLERAQYESMDLLMGKMLHHQEKAVVDFALDWIIKSKSEFFYDTLKFLSDHHPDEEIRAKCIYAAGIIAPEKNAELLSLFRSENPVLCAAAMTAMLQSEIKENYEAAENYLRQLAGSADKNDRMLAATIIGKAKNDNLVSLLIDLVNDKDKDIQKTGIRSSIEFSSGNLVQHLIPLLRSKALKKDVRHALVSMQEVSVEQFSELPLFRNDPIVKDLIRISSVVTYQASAVFLLKCINEHPAFTHDAIHGLWRLEFRPDHSQSLKLQNHLATQLEDALDISEQLSISEQQADHHLSKALYWELKNKTYTILYLLSFFYDREKLNAVIAALELRESFKTSNCIEMLEIMLPTQLFRDVNRLLEVVEMNYSLQNPKNRYKNISEVLKGIIGNPPFAYNRWTSAQAIYRTGEYKISDLISMLKKPAEEEDELIIKETRMFVISLYQ